ncbi:TIGR04551 family protein [Stigmatella sp. ncwal1]|uniref:TIGR04551 family protein n=2 Tax=Stigmatella ashevillensis TaxID=2995309 RepID=A0ABT5D8M6_9BACT|nr:TIGR04551 family protein [Stigmatella ashevillena]MDC0709926.1 TIGR04551 family protein [Stigmatella ashevillena]
MQVPGGVLHPGGPHHARLPEVPAVEGATPGPEAGAGALTAGKGRVVGVDTPPPRGLTRPPSRIDCPESIWRYVPMSHVLLAALLVASATATAQTSPPAPVPESATPAATPSAAPSTPAAASPSAASPLSPEAEAELARRLEAAKAEMREEIRAQIATQSLATASESNWQSEFTEERRKLEIFTLDGYLRLRPNLFYKFDLGQAPGRRLFPFTSPRSPAENTQAGTNMRLRLEPTFNVSEEVRIKLQVDALDNILLGSTPDSSFTGSDRDIYTIFSESQTPPASAINAFKDSISIKRAYGEVSTPVGMLRFGRMGSHWGLGMLRNDGNCVDCDFGDNVDRIQFVTEPFAGFYVTPMVDFNSEGVSSEVRNAEREPVDLTNADDSHSYVLAIARRDTDQQVRAKLDNNQGVLNYGLHFTYRTQRWEATGYEGGNFQGNTPTTAGFVPRDAKLYVPDLWLRYEERLWRLEVELAVIYGSIGNRALTLEGSVDPAQNQDLRILQFGGVAQGEYRLLNSKLKLGMEFGVASGDKAAGFGNYPRRRVANEDNEQLDGPQYTCAVGGCSDDAIRNFRFNRAYRVDLILWRELIGGLTDAVYFKPSLKYSIADGFDVYGSVIYSQALYAESTPSRTSKSLGVEVDIGARYETEDGFIAGIDWGILFPMSGLQDQGIPLDFETAQAIRGTLGIRF